MLNGTIRLKREDLYIEVWSQPMTKLAKKYGLSDVGLRKRCKKLRIPLPQRGHWQKSKYVKMLRRPPLPPMKEADMVEFNIVKKEKRFVGEEQNTEAQAMIAFEKLEENRIRVVHTLRDPHQYVQQTEKILSKAKPNSYDNGILNPKVGCLDIQVSPESLSRALLIMDALIKSLEARGLKVSISNKDKRVTSVSVLDETFEFCVKEFLKQTKHELTPAEKKKKEELSWYDYFPKYDYNPSGRLSLIIKTYSGDGIRKTWTDGKKQRVENCLNAFILGLIMIAVAKKVERIERARREREWQERENKRVELARLRREEEERVQALEKEASAWNKSQQIRAYLKAVRENALQKHGEIEPGSELDKWLTWADQQADRFDPLVESPPSILD